MCTQLALDVIFDAVFVGNIISVYTVLGLVIIQLCVVIVDGYLDRLFKKGKVFKERPDGFPYLMPVRSWLGGDVGNRTRVRKIRPSNIYERSRLIVFTERASNDKGCVQLTAGTRKFLFRMASGVLMRHANFVSPNPTSG